MSFRGETNLAQIEFIFGRSPLMWRTTQKTMFDTMFDILQKPEKEIELFTGV